jgi:hypothetical protein
MVVHALHVARRKTQDPRVQVLSSEEIQAPIALFSFLGLLEDI